MLNRYATRPVRVRQRFRFLARRLAGDSDHSGTGQGHVQVHNSIALIMRVVSTAEPAYTGGQPELSGATIYDNDATARELRSGSDKQVPELPKDYVGLPERSGCSVKIGVGWGCVGTGEDSGGDTAHVESSIW